jgi:hypothetical protein
MNPTHDTIKKEEEARILYQKLQRMMGRNTFTTSEEEVEKSED